MVNKIVESVDEAIAGIEDGMVLAVGGFGPAGVPFTLIDGVYHSGTHNLSVYSNNPGGTGDDGSISGSPNSSRADGSAVSPVPTSDTTRTSRHSTCPGRSNWS